MKDRQFMTVLCLVVAAGLVMGLVAFRMTAGNRAVETASVGNAAVANPNAPASSAADEVVDPPADSVPQAAGAESQNGEPSPPTTEPPEMQGPATGDAPGIAAEPPQQPGGPAETPSDSPPPQ